MDFRNTLVIMTSNLGSQWILELGEDDRAEMERRVNGRCGRTSGPSC